jgi:hypothetical protein
VTLQTVASLTSVIEDTSQGQGKTNETYIVQASLTIVTYDCQNMFIIQATGVINIKLFSLPLIHYKMCWISLKKLVLDKHSNLFFSSLNDEETSIFKQMTPSVNTVKHIFL